MSKFDKTKLIAIITAAVLGLVLILMGVLILGKKDPAEIQQPVQTETQATELQIATVPPTTEGTEPPETTEPDQTEPEETEPEETEPAETKPKETKPGNSTQTNKPGNTQKPQKEPDRTVRFPYTIAGTNLVIEQVNSYDGIFFEDGSDKEVSNVTAIVLTNKGSSCIEYVNITMKRGTTQLRFVGSSLEAGGTMIIMEADGKSFKYGEYKDCTAEIASMAELIMSENLVRVEEHADGGLLVTNLTDADIPCVRIFYKYYMDDVDVYVGGITYTAKVLDLPAGGSCTVTPSHYYPGFSTIVMVKTYDTKD